MDRRALTDREQAIATLAALGQTNAEIAAELGVSLATVKRHLANVMIKWNVRNRTRLALEAMSRGLITKEQLAEPGPQSPRRPQKSKRLKE